MQVSIKGFDVEMKIKNKGIELDVYKGDTHLGDLVITKSELIWCKGRTKRENGEKITWTRFIEFMENK